MDPKAEILERALDLAWSLWAELGVSGWQRRHTSHAIDPESLIVFTAWLGDVDPRLRDESTDWCIRYGRWVAGARLRNLVQQEPEAVRAALGTYAATVGAHSRTRWPFATEPRVYEPTGRSRIADFSRPSLIVLRLRGIFGVGARAEVLRVLLAGPERALSASDLADEVGYTKRSVADALDTLRMSGVLGAERVRNQIRFRLHQPDRLLGLVGGLPEVLQPWPELFRILRAVIDLAARAEGLDQRVRDVEMHRVLRDLEPHLRRAGIALGPSATPPAWTDFERWARALSAALASGEDRIAAWPRATARSVTFPGHLRR